MTERARRRKRIRRGAVAAAFLILAGVAAAIGVSRQQALDSAQRAEGSKLLALAQARFEDDPTEALAFTTASLELADTREARIFAVKVLGEAPPAFETVGGGSMSQPAFSPDGKWLAAGGGGTVVSAWAETGVRHAPLAGHELFRQGNINIARWVSAVHLVTGLSAYAHRVQIWSFPAGEKVRTIEFGGPTWWQVGPGQLFAETDEETAAGRGGILRLRSWRLPDGEARELGRVDGTALGASTGVFVPNGTGWLYTKGRTIWFRPLPADGRGDRVVGRHDSAVNWDGFLDPAGVVFREESGRIQVYRFGSDGQLTLAPSIPKPEAAPERIFPEPSGRWLRTDTYAESRARLWDLGTWPAARPLVLRRNTSWLASTSGFHPTGHWLAVSTDRNSKLTFWPLGRTYPTVVDGHTTTYRPLAFTPDSQSLVTDWADPRSLRLWPVGPEMGEGPRPLGLSEQDTWLDLSVEPGGGFVFVVSFKGGAYVVPLDGAPARRLEGFSEDTPLWAAAISPSGRRAATAFGVGDGERALRVWDVDSGEPKRYELPETSRAPTRDGGPTSERSPWERAIQGLGFVGESTLYSGGDGGVRRWDLESGTHELVFATRPGHGLTMRLDRQGRTALIRQWPLTGQECRSAELVDLQKGAARALPAFGECVHIAALALDASGTVAAAGDRDGLVRVGRLGHGKPHLLAGHSGTVRRVAISPDLRWVASAGEDSTLRLWPMPDLDKPPLHTLPHQELVSKLRSLTNLRAVRDPEAPNGWKIELDRFPGWKHVPEW
jgi:WD40 repeat protein